MRYLAVIALALLFTPSAHAATNNDDACDLHTVPAATLLLPFFEVDFKSPQTTARTTLFTITNTSNLPQIAHVVLWTDWAFPAAAFNLFLTGYDVVAVNLYDVFNRGVIAPGSSAVLADSVVNATAGAQPAPNWANPNITSLAGCTTFPNVMPSALLADLRLIFTTGRGSGAAIGCTTSVGGVHANAIGYATIDVAPACHTLLPNQPGYFSSINFDNVLIGDYQDINPNPATGNYASGNPLVHIRAVPEGGPAGSLPGTNLPYTFYDRYTALAGSAPRTIDRRQPLPSTFASRYIQGGTGAFNTNLKIWREGLTIANCSGTNAASGNSNMALGEVIRFDEHENATIYSYWYGYGVPGTPAAAAYTTQSSLWPSSSTSGDVGGWVYLNLNNGGSPTYSASRVGFSPAGSATRTRASQNWVIVSMFAEGRYSFDIDAAWLGNGCSPATLGSVIPGAFVGPAGGAPVCADPLPGRAPLPCSVDRRYVGANATP